MWLHSMYTTADFNQVLPFLLKAKRDRFTTVPLAIYHFKFTLSPAAF